MYEEFSDEDLARLADWAERQELGAEQDWKKGYQAIRQGADWIIRRRALKKHKELVGNENVTVLKQ